MNINRYWEHECNTELLCSRPRVDYRISEYLFDFINENILSKRKIVLSESYSFTLFLSVFNPENSKCFYANPFDTEQTKYTPYENCNIQTTKDIRMFCSSTLFNSTITPTEYAQIIYDLFALYFILRYKKLSKELFDDVKQKLDYDYINSFEFPATFENQKYNVGEGVIGLNPVYDKTLKKWINEREFDARNEYIKVFGK